LRRNAAAPVGGRAGSPSSLDNKAESALILEIAPHLDDFLADLFGIQSEFRALAARHHELAPYTRSSASSCSDAPQTR